MVRAPQQVRGATIRNDSNGHVQIRIIYTKFPHEPMESNDHIRQTILAQGQAHRAEIRTVNAGSYDMAASIEAIEAILANGQQFGLRAPFNGVNTVEADWFFVVANHGIVSVQRNQ